MAATRVKTQTKKTPAKRAPAKRGTAKRAQTQRRGTKPPARAHRSLRGSISSLRPVLQLEPYQIEILALALAAAGVLLGGVAYLHWNGGALGHGAFAGLQMLIGVLAYLAPAAMLAGALLILTRGLRSGPPLRPVRAGAVCLLLAAALALAAGTLGLGPGREPTVGFWLPAVIKPRGGLLGGAEYWAAKHLLSVAGADILAIFGLCAALILLTGATLAGLMLTARNHASNAIRLTEEIRVSRRDLDAFDDDPELVEVPDPDTAQMVISQTHVQAPAVDDPLGALVPEIPLFDDPPEFEPGTFEPEFLGLSAAEEEQPLPTSEPAGEPVSRRQDPKPEELTPQGRYRASVTDDPEFVWRVPGGRFLTRSTRESSKPDTAGQAQTAKALVEALGHFGIACNVVGRVTGPHITRYELQLAPGVKMSKVANLKDDLAYALAATDIRILAPIPGKTAVGIEVPNASRKVVHLGDVFQEPPEGWSPLTVWLGKDISGKAIGADLTKMPHLLVAGTTGAGKSACVNAMLCSVLLRATPHDVRLVLVDPKQVELNHYDSIPHLLTPVITSPRMAANALQNLVKEMEMRYGIMSLSRTRSLPELNKVRESRGEQALPYILCVIDELADLMMVAPADVEDSIIRLAQKARAVGIHLVLATQSPRVDVITGMIKANVPSRIAFSVSSQTDSRVILDQGGAESLLGQGDMLFSPVGTSRLQRIQGAYIDEEQILELTELWRRQGEPQLRAELLEEVVEEEAAASGADDDGFDPDEDPLLEEAISLVAQMGTASTSMLQRRLRLGYTRAGRLIDMLERRGVISGYEGSKPRQVLISEADVPRILVALSEAKKGASGRMAVPQLQLSIPPAPDASAPEA